MKESRLYLIKNLLQSLVHFHVIVSVVGILLVLFIGTQGVDLRVGFKQIATAIFQPDEPSLMAPHPPTSKAHSFILSETHPQHPLGTQPSPKAFEPFTLSKGQF
ncbi:MAG: hypothetical protein K2X66_08230 [Cyanobacteria bacterium]|nr:hypothetical protein [Cyanobacteriota bacterium]